MDLEKERQEGGVAFMHGLAAEDVDAANITGEENRAGELAVTAALPEEQFDKARDVADTYGFKPAGRRGEDETTDQPRFAFMPRF